MKKQILIIVLLTCITPGFSQLSVFSRYMPYNQKTEVYPVTTNPDLGLPLIFIAGRDVKVFYLADGCKYQTEISLKKPAKNSKLYLGSYTIDSSIVINFSDKSLTYVSQLLVNLSNGEITQETGIVKHEQKYLMSWETKEGLLVMGIVPNSNRLIVSKYFGWGKVSVYEFDFTDLAEYNINTSLFQMFDSDSKGLQKINNSIPVSLYLASAKSKAYMVNNKIIITLDLFDDATYYLSLDLDNDSHAVNKYPYFKSGSGKLATKNNSFLYDSTLFQISFNDEALGLNVQSIEGNTIAKVYSLIKGKKGDFLNSPMELRNEKEGFLYGDAKIRELKSTKKFFNLLSGMDPTISAFGKKSNFQILMGGVEEIQQSGGVSANVLIASGGEMKVGPGDNLVVPEPDFYFPTNYSFIAYSSYRSVYFSSVVNTSSLDHSDIPITRYTYDYIIKYANYMPGHHGLVTIFKMKGDYYFGYYSYNSHTYNIEWFKNVDDYSVQY